MKKEIKLLSAIKCPNCGQEKSEKMPVDSCVYFYKCAHCDTLLKPRKNDCCVFCSYGNVKCPSKQTSMQKS